jgi:hypothetical protein
VYAQLRSASSSNKAVVLYHDIKLKSPKFPANSKGVRYTVSFDVAPAAGTTYNLPFPFTREIDYIVLEVVKQDNTTVLNGASFRYYPSSFADVKYTGMYTATGVTQGRSKWGLNLQIASLCSSSGCIWNRAAFTYIGDGDGPVYLRFRCGAGNDGVWSAGTAMYNLCGAIDNLAIAQITLPASTTPSAAPTTLSSKFLVISNYWGVINTECGNGLSRPAISEIEVWNGNTKISGLSVNVGRYSVLPPDRFALRYSIEYGSNGPDKMTDGDYNTYFQSSTCWSVPQAAIWMDLSSINFDRIVVVMRDISDDASRWAGYRIALVSSPDAVPSWQSSFPASTFSAKRKFSFWPKGAKMRCMQSQFCAGTVGNSTSKAYSFGSSTTTLTSDCTSDEDCSKKYNSEWSQPRKIYTGVI